MDHRLHTTDDRFVRVLDSLILYLQGAQELSHVCVKFIGDWSKPNMAATRAHRALIRWSTEQESKGLPTFMRSVDPAWAEGVAPAPGFGGDPGLKILDQPYNGRCR